MNTTSKGKNQDKVRQLTAAERAALDEEATTCAAEVVGDPDPATTAGLGGKIKRLATRVTGAARRAKTWARDRMAPENVDAALSTSKSYALSTSKSYAVLAAKYGADVAREAVMRRVRAAIERKICGAVAGPGPGFTDPAKSAPTRG